MGKIRDRCHDRRTGRVIIPTIYDFGICYLKLCVVFAVDTVLAVKRYIWISSILLSVSTCLL